MESCTIRRDMTNTILMRMLVMWMVLVGRDECGVDEDHGKNNSAGKDN